ncbi:MAG TPA: hypothetical protein VF503_01185 [Sphingobium sp.]|uniref:hypothetical protein n=1 Tax=Sphingobium sp. TaxID=1912891 RepID=UPI002ED012A5
MTASTIKVLTCDRCGHVEEFRNEAQRPKWGRIAAQDTGGAFSIGMNGIDPADLCEACTEGLIAWTRREESIAPLQPIAVDLPVHPVVQDPAVAPFSISLAARGNAVTIARNNMLVQVMAAGVDIDPETSAAIDERAEAIVGTILLALNVEEPA